MVVLKGSKQKETDLFSGPIFRHSHVHLKIGSLEIFGFLALLWAYRFQVGRKSQKETDLFGVSAF